MKKIKIAALVSTTLLFISCKRDYTCFCADSNLVPHGITIHDTKAKAKKTCEASLNPFGTEKCHLEN